MNIEEVLLNQMNLLSERSAHCDDMVLNELSKSMCLIAKTLSRLRDINYLNIDKPIPSVKQKQCIYTCEEIAERYGVKPGTVWKWIRKEKLIAMKIGKCYKVREEDLMKFEKEKIRNY